MNTANEDSSIVEKLAVFYGIRQLLDGYNPESGGSIENVSTLNEIKCMLELE